MNQLLNEIDNIKQELDEKARFAADRAEKLKVAQSLVNQIHSDAVSLPEQDRQHIAIKRADDAFSIFLENKHVITLQATENGVAVFYPEDDTQSPPSEYHSDENTLFRIAAKAIEVSKKGLPHKGDLGGMVRLWD